MYDVLKSIEKTYQTAIQQAEMSKKVSTWLYHAELLRGVLGEVEDSIYYSFYPKLVFGHTKLCEWKRVEQILAALADYEFGRWEINGINAEGEITTWKGDSNDS
jgi:hypothetical protein